MKIDPPLSKLQRVKVGRKLLTHPVVDTVAYTTSSNLALCSSL